MRYAIWFAVPAFLVSGALYNAVAHNAEGVLGLAFMTALAAAAYGWHLQSKLEHAFDNPEPKTYPVSKVVAFHRVKDVLLTHSIPSLSLSSLPEPAHWSFTQLDPESGVLTAVLTFTEQMSPIPGGPGSLSPQPRRVVLQTLFSNPCSLTSTSVEFRWEVCSPINRDTVNALITSLSIQLHRSLSQSMLFVH